MKIIYIYIYISEYIFIKYSYANFQVLLGLSAAWDLSLAFSSLSSEIMDWLMLIFSIVCSFISFRALCSSEILYLVWMTMWDDSGSSILSSLVCLPFLESKANGTEPGGLSRGFPWPSRVLGGIEMIPGAPELPYASGNRFLIWASGRMIGCYRF